MNKEQFYKEVKARTEAGQSLEEAAAAICDANGISYEFNETFSDPKSI